MRTLKWSSQFPSNTGKLRGINSAFSKSLLYCSKKSRTLTIMIGCVCCSVLKMLCLIMAFCLPSKLLQSVLSLIFFPFTPSFSLHSICAWEWPHIGFILVLSDIQCSDLPLKLSQSADQGFSVPCANCGKSKRHYKPFSLFICSSIVWGYSWLKFCVFWDRKIHNQIVHSWICTVTCIC